MRRGLIEIHRKLICEGSVSIREFGQLIVFLYYDVAVVERVFPRFANFKNVK